MTAIAFRPALAVRNYGSLTHTFDCTDGEPAPQAANQ